MSGVIAGLELEMPGSNGTNDEEIIKAVKEGYLEESYIDEAVNRILNIIFRYLTNKKNDVYFDREKDHKKAVEIAKECIVLLKNEEILPLKKDSSIAFIGEFAVRPRYQGGGSSHINAHQVPSTLEASGKYSNITYAKGFSATEDRFSEELEKEAVDTAVKASCAVIFAGLPDSFESEGYDRNHMHLPECQNQLIEKICQVQENVVVVLHNGSPVEMPWASKVKGIVEAYLGGEGIGEALPEILFGKDNPCGKLAETFPKRLEDNPSYLNFPGKNQVVEYKEGIFIGYRYYDSKNMDVLFPFGHGLSYTTYEYSNLLVSKKELKDTETLTVSLDVTNHGNMAGKEIAQLYIRDLTGITLRPDKELKNFVKISLEPGETKKVTMDLDKRSFAWYNTNLGDWYVGTGEYEILIGKSSRDIVLKDKVNVISTAIIEENYNKDVTLGELLANKKTKDYTRTKILPYASMFLDRNNGDFEDMMAAMVKIYASSLPKKF